MNILSEKRCNYELDLNLQAEQKDADWFKNKEKYSQVSHLTKSLTVLSKVRGFPICKELVILEILNLEGFFIFFVPS